MKVLWGLVAVLGLLCVGVGTMSNGLKSDSSQLAAGSGKKDDKKDDEENLALRAAVDLEQQLAQSNKKRDKRRGPTATFVMRQFS